MQGVRWLVLSLWSAWVAVSWAQSDILWRQPILSGQAIAWSADGQYLAAAALGGQIALYRTSDYRLVRVLRGDRMQVNALAFSPNSQRLAAACDDGTVRLYQVATGSLSGTINAHTGAAMTVAFSPDGSLLATGGTDNLAKLWNANTGTIVHTLSGHSAAVGSLVFSPDGLRLATSSWDGTLRIWQVSNGVLLQNIDAHAAPIYAVAWSPDGTTLATGSSDWDIKLWSASDGSWQRTLNGHSDTVSSLVFTADGSQLVSGSWDMTARVWNPADGSTIHTLTGHTREVLSLALAPDGTRLASGGGEHTVRLWRVSDGAAQGRLDAPADAIYGVGFVAGGSVISAGFDAVLQRWSASDGSFQQALAQDSPILALAVSPDGTLVATGDWNGNIHLRMMPGGTLVRQWSAGSDEIKSLAFSPDGSVLASASMNGTVQLWGVPGGMLIRTLSGHTGGATAVAFSADGASMATGDSSGVIRLWNVSTGDLTRTVNAHGGYITSVAFSPDGARLASCSTDSTARLWDLPTGTEVATLSHPDTVSGVAYTPDGSRLLTISWDGAVRMWNVSTGALYRQLNAHDMPIHALAISPDGQTMLTGGEDGLVYAWVAGLPNQPPDAPVLISPANNASMPNRTPTFQVQAHDPEGNRVQLTLEIIASDNRTRSYQTGWVDSDASVSIGVPSDQPLLPGVYSWQARATDEHGATGAWSEVRLLTIENQAPGQPVIVEPADGATLSSTPTFRLRLSDADNDPVHAVIEITGNNQTLRFETEQVASGSEVRFTIPDSQALPPGDYTWQTKTLDAYGGDSGWTGTRRFSVPQPSQPPDIPVLISPSDGSTVTPTPTFRVRLSDPNGDTVKAMIEIIAQSGATRTLETAFVVSGSEASVTVPSSQPLSAGSYTWRARAQDNAGNLSDWSSHFGFTVSATNRPPEVPQMLEPADNATVTPTPTFRLRLSDADGNAVSATIQITSSSGVSFEFSTESVSSGSEVRFTIPASQALAPGAYTWRARARDNEGAWSDWSAPARFTVPEPDNPPGTPELVSPAHGAYASRTPVFRLKATDPEGQPLSFEIKVSAGSQTLRFTTDQVPSGTTLAFPIPDSQPLPIGDVTWQARARDVAGNFSSWSETRSLHVLGEAPQVLQGVLTFALSLRPAVSDPNSLRLNGAMLVRWDAEAQQYTSVSQLQPGEGYFLKATSPIRPDLQGEPITGEIVLPLQPGWNLIANPSLTPIVWDLDTVQIQRSSERKSLREAQQAGWVDDYLWTWDQNPNDPMRGQYLLVYDVQELPGVPGELVPWRAYWILAREECTLVLNTGGRGRAMPLTRSPTRSRRNQKAWSLRIEAVGQDGSSGAVWIGVSGGRSVMANPAPAPPEDASPLQLRLRRSEGYFATDLRHEFGRSTRWTLEVAVAPSNQPQPITLRLSNLLSLPHGVNLALVDEQRGIRRPLRTTSAFTFTAPAAGGVYRFTIEPISSRALLRVLNPSIQGGRGAGQSFTLSFTLTAEARLQVQIRAGGQTIRTLSDGRTRNAGLQQFVWDGRNDAGVRLPPGQYLAEIVAIGEDGQLARASVPIVMTR